MKILVIGGGGREHALVWKLRQSPRVSEVLCAPGNAGIATIARTFPVKISAHESILELARDENVGLVVIGPDDALAAGLADFLQHNGVRVFGPSQSASRLEWSKAFAKDFMIRHGIPTAASGTFEDADEAQNFCQKARYPLVIKADGLALGKGVIIAQNHWQSAVAIHRIMTERVFGSAGAKVVIEEFLTGQECSIHALVDGSRYLLFPAAQDHKAAYDGDLGPNTGGMGTFSPPAKLVTPELTERIAREVMDRFIAGLRADGLEYRGMLFPGLMVTADGPRVLEFNCRFGDPETQVLLARLESDLLDLLEATVDGTLDTVQPRWRDESAVCVIMASGGYPGSYPSGIPISGLDDAEKTATVFHAGTRCEGEQFVTAGGRVLGVTALGEDLVSARAAAYGAVEKITFRGAQYRTDIGAKGV